MSSSVEPASNQRRECHPRSLPCLMNLFVFRPVICTLQTASCACRKCSTLAVSGSEDASTPDDEPLVCMDG